LGRKGYNGRVERSHRTDDEAFYCPYLLRMRDQAELLRWAHHGVYFCNVLRPHLGRGMEHKPPLTRWQEKGYSGAATIAAVVVKRPQPTAEAPQHLGLDKAYDNPTGHQAVAQHGYVPHIRRVGEGKLATHDGPKHPAPRWVVERTLAWLSKCRAILVRYGKKVRNYLALLKLACGLLWYRRYHQLSLSR